VYNLSTCSMLVEMTASVWTARKLDRAKTDEVVHGAHAAAKDAARVNKSLLAGRGELDVIQAHVTAARTYLYTNTLPWSDSGLRLLPTLKFMEFNDRMDQFGSEFTKLVADFVQVYPTLITAQAMALGDMFSRNDYPTADEISRKFAFGVNYMPVPNAGDFRVDVGTAAQKELQEKLEQLANERVERAMGDIKERLKDHLLRMSDRLATDRVGGEEKPRRFHDTLVDGAIELCEVVKALNVTHDAAVEGVRQQLSQFLTGVTPQELRKNEVIRTDVKKNVDMLLARLDW
jgi:hypothetical protein